MIIGIGCDIVNVQRINKLIKKFGQRFFKRVFTYGEQEDISRQMSQSTNAAAFYCAKRFAAKEAVMKAIGTGLGQKVSWQDIEVIKNGGKPMIQMTGFAQKKLISLVPSHHQPTIHLSLSDDLSPHDIGWAQAFVIIEVTPRT